MGNMGNIAEYEEVHYKPIIKGDNENKYVTIAYLPQSLDKRKQIPMRIIELL